MSANHPMSDAPRQLLPREAYISQEWFDLEQTHLFGASWIFAGVVKDVANAGDYLTVQAGPSSLAVVRGADGEVRAFQNICAHRGTELLEGKGNAGKTLVCPYHRWAFNLDGGLRGVPDQSECFPDLKKEENGLQNASIGIYKGLIFVHPEADPDESFDEWLSTLPDVSWPHDLSDDGLVEQYEITYEMKCNWKVFYENAIDGYHLAYLHENTLGKLYPNANVWVEHGRHLVWYSTERDGERSAVPELIENLTKGAGLTKIRGAEDDRAYGGVYTLFPVTLMTPNPHGFSISQLIPVTPDITHLKVRGWGPKGSYYRTNPTSLPGYDKETGLIKSELWTKHALETYDFQTEDVWVCEKMQRAMKSPYYKVGALAAGGGAESPLMHFQQCLLDYMPGAPGKPTVLAAD